MATTSFTHDDAHLAAAYERLSDSQFESGKRLAERLELGPGLRVLDVGCGTGRLARWLVDRVAPGGSIIGIDPLPERVAIARAHAASGTSFELGQAEDLRAFAPETFDAVAMSAVFHWIDVQAKALAEVHRVLRPGGRLGVTTLVRELMHKATVGSVIGGVLSRASYAASVDLSKFAIASRALTTTEILNLVDGAGLELAELHIVERVRIHASGEELIDFMEASSFGNFSRMVPDDLKPTFRADLIAAFDARREPRGIILRDWGLVFVAKRPVASL
jgi:arsenite methyltransferase